jgi:hypothetical protein
VWEDGELTLHTSTYDVEAIVRRIEHLDISKEVSKSLIQVLRTGSLSNSSARSDIRTSSGGSVCYLDHAPWMRNSAPAVSRVASITRTKTLSGRASTIFLPINDPEIMMGPSSTPAARTCTVNRPVCL